MRYSTIEEAFAVRASLKILARLGLSSAPASLPSTISPVTVGWSLVDNAPDHWQNLAASARPNTAPALDTVVIWMCVV